MNYRLIDFPVYHPVEKYQDAINRAVEIISKEKGVSGIYNFGKIRNPGISDADILVVFADGQLCNLNLLSELKGNERYYFMHTQLGMPESLLKQVYNYQLHISLDLIYGKPVDFTLPSISQEDKTKLEKQIALEYLVNACLKNYRISYEGVIKVRGLLLEAYAIRHDLRLLGITSGKLFDLVEEIAEWRQNWFDSTPSNTQIIKWFNEYSTELEAFLRQIFLIESFFLATGKMVMRFKDTQITSAETFSIKPLCIPGVVYRSLPLLAQKVIRKKINMYHVKFPVANADESSLLNKRIKFLRECVAYNQKHLPYFYPFNTVLEILLQ
ncbi:MAG TPA: hypothetical protein PKN75_10825 [Bacteroidia bacterium]|nr:hypothetical protein [Bacteroidia bacterium]HNU34072.1 hypothetical protein [Bacteroidia bacterium]